MSRVGSEILYLGPLSGGSGLPCDKPQPLDETYDEGAVAAANSDVTKVALSTAGEAPDTVPTTCIKGDDIRKTCWQGRAWEYDYCWPAKKAELWRWVSGDKWKRVDRFTGYKDDACGKSTPYRVIFRQIETKKNSWYEVYLPEQTGLRDGGSDPFKTTVS